MSYASQSALTLGLIKAKGKLTTFTRQGATVDPVTQSGPATASSYTAYAVAFPLNATKAAALYGASSIQKARLDVHIALSGVSETPKAGDRFAWGSRTYAILADPELLDPDGAGAFYAHVYAEAA